MSWTFGDPVARYVVDVKDGRVVWRLTVDDGGHESSSEERQLVEQFLAKGPLVAETPLPILKEIAAALGRPDAPWLTPLPEDVRALHRAAERGRSRELLEVLARGVNADTPDHDGLTPLWKAVRAAQWTTTTDLIRRSSRLDGVFAGSTILIETVKKGWRDVVPMLLMKGADVSLRDSHGRTPLMHLPAGEVGGELATILLDAGAKPADRDEDGDTALHLACDRAAVEAVSVLLSRGADPNGEGRGGRLPLDAAYESGSAATFGEPASPDAALISALTARGARRRTGLRHAGP